jgi:hypothetical protein
MPSRREKQSQNTQVSIQSKVIKMEEDILVEERKLQSQMQESKEKMRHLVRDESIKSFKQPERPRSSKAPSSKKKVPSTGDSFHRVRV